MMNKIVLIDAYAQIYRSFYAVRGLTNARGEMVNALYGIGRLLLNLERSLPSSYGAVVFDKGKPARRVELCPEYKAQRPPMPDDLRSQLPAIREWLAAFGWPILEQEGAEADDIIAAVASVREGLPVAILTHDKDIAQLVSAEVELLQSVKGDAWESVGPAEVEAKFGVPVVCLGDYLSLLGDSSDNIRGVDGVGPKTAAKLLQDYGSIDGILAHLNDISNGRLREKLQAAGDLLTRNRELVRLDAALPDGWTGLDGIRRRPPDWARIKTLAEAEGFKSMLTSISEKQQKGQQLSLF
ncbi:MAG: 5'-3' exonuclease H3TH domain-containing protein [Lentisphaeria bacterium]|nr:5'-3' exonuclease H3TH domain-containing protein [Lentisphaeria bacterium]